MLSSQMNAVDHKLSQMCENVSEDHDYLTSMRTWKEAKVQDAIQVDKRLSALEDAMIAVRLKVATWAGSIGFITSIGGSVITWAVLENLKK